MCDFFRSTQHGSRLKMLSKSEVQTRALSRRQRGRAGRSITNLTCRSWKQDFVCGPESYYPVFNYWWWLKQDLMCGDLKKAAVTHIGCEVCKSSLDGGHISCVTPASIYSQVKKTGEKTQRKNTGAGVRKRRRVFPTHHSFSCYHGVVERFIDYLKMHSVRVDKAAVRCDRDTGSTTKQANMNDRE